MKFVKFAVAAALALSFGSAYAFHEGGVAYCEGCHTMHNSRNGAAMMPKNATQFTGVKYLLQGTDQSSTCLICHGKGKGSGYYVFSASGTPTNMTPGGDFGWITLGDRAWTYPRAGSNVATARGHNVIAADRGLTVDGRLVSAPGGTLSGSPYPANALACSSCHDPHGKYRLMPDGTYQANAGYTKGAPSLTANPTTASLPIKASGSYGAAPTTTEAVGAYRILAGVGYKPASLAGTTGIEFKNDPPIAVAPETYNRSENVSETIVAYGKGMSEWCQNCHAAIHNGTGYAAGTKFVHPAGNDAKLTTETFKNYNAYVKSGDMTGTAGYTSLVPYEQGSGDPTALLAIVESGTVAAASATNNVSCLSCHRAHATAFESMTRWNNRSEFLTVDGKYADYSLAIGWNNTLPDPAAGEGAAGNIAAGLTATEYQAAMYDRSADKFATFQRSLCNKCHAKD